MEEEGNKLLETVKYKYTEKVKKPEPEHHTLLTFASITFPIILTNCEGFAFDIDELIERTE